MSSRDDEPSMTSVNRQWEELFQIETLAISAEGFRADALCFKCKCSHGCRWLVADPQIFGSEFFSTRVSEAGLREGTAIRETLEQIDAIHSLLRTHTDLTELARSTSEMADITSAGKIVSLIGIDGAHSIDGSMGVLRMFFELGARYVTLSDADLSASPDVARGTTKESLEHTVREANRLGMLLHAAGASRDGIRLLLQLSSAPIIASASSGAAPARLDAEAMELIKARGGLVMADLTSAESTATGGRQVAESVERIVNVVGVDHVGLASNGGAGTVVRDQARSVYPELRRELADRNISGDDIEKILGGNFLRTWRAAEDVHRQ
jgi:membrane dipeptidase